MHFCHYDKTSREENKGRKGLFSLQFLVHHWGSQGRHSSSCSHHVPIKEWRGRNTLTLPDCCLCPVNFFHSHNRFRVLPREWCHHNERGLPTPINNQDSPPQTCPYANLLSSRISSQITLGYIKLEIKKTNKIKKPAHQDSRR